MFSDQIIKPTLVISEEKVVNNLERMFRKAAGSKAVLRPHFKTHQSHKIGNLFRKKGIDKITVSSVGMAEHFVADGWNDITIAFVVNLRETGRINDLAAKVTLNVLVDSLFTAKVLSGSIKHDLNVFIKTDTGYHRTGLLPESTAIPEIIEVIENSANLNFAGFLTHAGHTYHAKGKAETLAIMEDAGKKLLKLKQQYVRQFPDIIVSYGDTPSCSMADDCSGFDEIRPGNFVYYDVMQYHLGSCTLDEIAVTTACPVVSVFPEREEIVIYGGAVHLSKESIEADNGFRLYGYLVNYKESGWSDPVPGAYVSALSQEHGIVKVPKKYIGSFKPGDLVGILPVHSCLTADLLKGRVKILNKDF